MPAAEFVLIANTKMPAQRAQALQVVQSSAAFARAGLKSTLLVADRKHVQALPLGTDLWDYYGVPRGPRPTLERVPVLDWIESVPVALQFLPARLEELSFARRGARMLRERFPGALVLARELEVGLLLARSGRGAFLLEQHRVPGGRLRRRWLLEAARGALGVIAISGGVRDDLLELGVEAAKIRVEHDALEPGRFSALPARDEARRRLDLGLSDTVVVYTGGLMAWKGVEVLVEAARRLPALRFVIAGGTADDVQRLRARAAGLAHVRIDGFQAPERVGLYLAAADLGVVPNLSTPALSARYTSPLKVFESFAVGLPLVASDLPSLRELLVHGEDALLVAPDDSAALAQGILQLAGDLELRSKFRARGLARAPQCTWDARARRILDWADPCLGRGRS